MPINKPMELSKINQSPVLEHYTDGWLDPPEVVPVV